MAILGGRFKRVREDFTCDVCGTHVTGNGFTNHCPNCLCSKHVDVMPGDRSSKCLGIMRPISVQHRGNSKMIYQRCERCGVVKRVNVAENDNVELISHLSTIDSPII